MELREGRATPLPDYVATVQDAQYWHVSPMELETWPLSWIQAGRVMREAATIAEERRRQKG